MLRDFSVPFLFLSHIAFICVVLYVKVPAYRGGQRTTAIIWSLLSHFTGTFYLFFLFICFLFVLS